MPISRAPDGTASDAVPWRAVSTICLVTAMLVTGHYISYSYLALIIAPAGLGGALLPAALAGYGVAGLLGVLATGRVLDRHPRPTAAVIIGGLVVGVGVLATTDVLVVVIASLFVWGASAAALPAMLNTAALHVSPERQDAASGAYVTAYQIGISSGSGLGAVLIADGPAARLPAWSMIALVLGALVVVRSRSFGRVRADD